MRGGTLFSGIGAPECAAPWIDWRWCAEIEAFPSAVHAARFPSVPNLGDVTKVDWDAVEPVDVLVAGSPCQSFSVAGKRLGLDDPRGNLALVTIDVARRVRADWLVFENVPGLLSSAGGWDFGSFLGTLAEHGFDAVWRVLDAQFFGVAQRRRRLFLVASAGGRCNPAPVLLEPDSLQGNPAPRREAGEGTAAAVIKGAAIGREPENGPQYGEVLTDGSCYTLNCTEQHAVASTGQVSHCLNAKGGAGRMVAESETLLAVAPTLTGDAQKTPANDFNMNGGLIAHSLRGEGFDASEDGTGRGTPLVPVAFAENSRAELRLEGGDGQRTGALSTGGGKPGQGVPMVAFGWQNSASQGDSVSEHITPTLDKSKTPAVALGVDLYNLTLTGNVAATLATDGGGTSSGPSVATPLAVRPDGSVGTLVKSQTYAVAFDMRGREGGAQFEGPHDTANIRASSGGSSRSYVAHLASKLREEGLTLKEAQDLGRPYAVRRLTPTECERLQGFPDGWTAITYRNKPAADGPRYKALGNSMAVPVMEWILNRLRMVDAAARKEAT